MNAEKELLLVLLIEKYGNKPVFSGNLTTDMTMTKGKKRKLRKPPNRWTDQQREYLVSFDGHELEWSDIAQRMQARFPEGHFNNNGVKYQMRDIKARMFKNSALGAWIE
jgi:hypothetical protein